MDQLMNFLNHTVLTLADQPITVADLLIVPTLVLTGWLLARLAAARITRLLERRSVAVDVIYLVRRVFFVVVVIVLTMTVLDLLSVPLTAFAFISGAVAIGVGFGAQNIINNFISGWILLWERPIRIGDFLEVGDASGTVEAINTRSTRFRRVDGVHMLIPNSALLENTVTNWTLMDDVVRTSVRVGVAYGSPTRKVKALIEAAVDAQTAVLEDPPRLVFFSDFGDSALIFDAYFWVNTRTEGGLRRVRSDVRFAIDDAFAEAGIVIAFPQRDVHLEGTLNVETRAGTPAQASPPPPAA